MAAIRLQKRSSPVRAETFPAQNLGTSRVFISSRSRGTDTLVRRERRISAEIPSSDVQNWVRTPRADPKEHAMCSKRRGGRFAQTMVQAYRKNLPLDHGQRARYQQAQSSTTRRLPFLQTADAARPCQCAARRTYAGKHCPSRARGDKNSIRAADVGPRGSTAAAQTAETASAALDVLRKSISVGKRLRGIGRARFSWVEAIRSTASPGGAPPAATMPVNRQCGSST
jgi:hypothetical protein